MNTITKRAATASAFLGTVLTMGFILAGPASATPADPIDAAFTSMEGKVTTYGVAIVSLVVLAVALFLGIKYLKRGVSKA